MGQWTKHLSKNESDIDKLLGSIPGPMCSKIDTWVGKASTRRLTSLGRRRYYDDADALDPLFEAAEAIENERNDAVDGLEECRTALEVLRGAVENLVDAYREERDGREAAQSRLSRLTPELRAALDEAGVDPDDKLKEGDAVRALTAERDQARRERDEARGVSR